MPKGKSDVVSVPGLLILSSKMSKTMSNSPEVLGGIKTSTSSSDVLRFGPEENTKTLGLLWSSKNDNFGFYICTSQKTNRVTKRIILSDTARIFDPLGLISPCVVTAKVILQDLWNLKLSWDDPIPGDLLARWSKFQSEFAALNQVSIHRHIVCCNPVRMELHGFADASQRAYGCCIYIRSMDTNGQSQVHLLCSKTRVAPLKSISIPRLELCAAQMLGRLYEQVVSSLTMKIEEYFM
ncbi:hypothetical protein NQ317_015315 [Molorchus minor]|uniref:Uncharacterized protein n=1 Tax=Molorchus minor TaxID=1323400 RepID=A0ABQ9JCD2_9CUCU|nr:hypothetical protein NQ317_015315 [Molorchus minor]